MQTCYSIPHNLSAGELLARLPRPGNIQEDSPRDVIRTFLDSFDWRVFTAGGSLERESCADEHRLLWRTLDGEALLASAPVTGKVRFATDLPAGRLRDLLQPALAMRALLPLIQYRCRTRTLRVLDREHKTVLRLRLEDCRIQDADGERTLKRERRLLLLPVKGYDKPLRTYAKALERAFGRPQPVANPLLTGLESIGRSPGDYSSKLVIPLEPGTRADVSAKLIFSHLLEAMRVNEDGIHRDLDSEFLHDFRVAVRRTRSALTQIKDVFPASMLERYLREFAWLGQISGPGRDMDVYLLAFDDYKASLPETMQRHLDPLRDFLRAHQALEYRSLSKHLHSARYGRLTRDWTRFIARPVAARPVAANALLPIRTLADLRIWRMYRRVLKEGRAIDAESPAEDLHELRKSCKKLRYLMEFFRGLYPDNRIARLIKVLKRFQDNLGEFQDLDVQRQSLHHFEDMMIAEHRGTKQTIQAIELLVHRLEERKEHVRAEFDARFRVFAEARNRQRFKDLFGAQRKQDQAQT